MLEYAAALLLLLAGTVLSSPMGFLTDRNQILDTMSSFKQEEASLNEMFKEVEKLMEDTRHKLQDAVKEMEADEELIQNEILESDLDKLPPNYHNETNQEMQIENASVHTHHDVDKVTNNRTGSTVYSERIITSVRGEEYKRNHDCIFDEDCGKGNYCYSAILTSKCLPCRTQDMNCTRDGECCRGLCVWGQCAKDTRKGENGTICENQGDCNPGTCCAFQTNLLFPVCTSLAAEGMPCHDPSNQLLDLITWEMDPDGILDRCPCAKGWICQHKGHGLVSKCERPINNKSESQETTDVLQVEDLPFPDLMPGEATENTDSYEGDSIIQQVHSELESTNSNNWNQDASEAHQDSERAFGSVI